MWRTPNELCGLYSHRSPSFHIIVIELVTIREAWTKGMQSIHMFFGNILWLYKSCPNKVHAWYWHWNRHIGHWNRTENPELNLKIYSQLIFIQSSKNTCWRNKVSSINGVKKSVYSCVEEQDQTPNSPHVTKVNPSKVIEDLNIKPKIIRLLEKHRGNTSGHW